MKVIVGLGNRGIQYAKTRHNIGFEVVECLASQWDIDINRNKHKGLVGQGYIHGEKVILVMPMTYMNLSGECVISVMNYYDAKPEDLIVVYDDISMNLGSLRIRKKGSAGGHNGIKNIIQHVKTDEFVRYKVGIGPQPQGVKSEDYVLKRFHESEMDTMIDTAKHTAKAIEDELKNGVDSAMNNFNRKL